MKNLILMCAVFATVAMFSSCKKDYTCTCTFADGLGGTQTSISELTDAKKSDAEDACSALETAAQLADPDATCTLD